MDTVVVYKISKIDYTYLQGVDFTPLYAHPLFVYFTDGSPSAVMNPWHMYIQMSHGKFGRNPIVDKFVDIILELWEDAALQRLKDQVDIDLGNLHGILQYCDVYSLGASIMMTALNNELKFNTDQTTELNYRFLYDIGKELVFFAFTRLPTKHIGMGGSNSGLSSSISAPAAWAARRVQFSRPFLRSSTKTQITNDVELYADIIKNIKMECSNPINLYTMIQHAESIGQVKCCVFPKTYDLGIKK